jgi:hypothetical protein
MSARSKRTAAPAAERRLREKRLASFLSQVFRTSRLPEQRQAAAAGATVVQQVALDEEDRDEEEVEGGATVGKKT